MERTDTDTLPKRQQPRELWRNFLDETVTVNNAARLGETSFDSVAISPCWMGV